MVHVPEFTRVTMFPATVHTLMVREFKLTGSPELAEELMANGEVPSVAPLSAANVIVWELVPPPDPAGLTAKDWPTDGAAAEFTFPACAAEMTQVPVLTNVTMFPATVHTPVVVEVKLTGRPELAVALIANGEVPSVAPLSTANAIVWEPRMTVKLPVTAGAAEYVVFPS